MRKRQLGSSGLEVSAIGYGAMPLSLEGRPKRAVAVSVIEEVLAGGISFIDTAAVYHLPEEQGNHNEELLAEAFNKIGSRAADVVIATKGGMIRTSGRWEIEGAPEQIERSILRSHAALGGKKPIDLWQHHWPDPRHSIRESLRPVQRAVEAGLIKCVGVGNYTRSQIEEASEIVEVASVQSQYNLWNRQAESNGVLEYCESRGIIFLPWRPLGGKWLAGRLGEVAVLQAIAQRHATSTFAVVLAWQMQRYACILPIPGTRNPQHLWECAAALDVVLSPEEADRIAGLGHNDLPQRHNAPPWQPAPPLSDRS